MQNSSKIEKLQTISKIKFIVSKELKNVFIINLTKLLNEDETIRYKWLRR